MAYRVNLYRKCYRIEDGFTLDIAELQDKAADAAKLLKAMSNESRLLILCHLAEDEMSVGELQSILNLSQSALSQHLALLRRMGVVSTRRSSQSIYYSLASEPAKAIMATMYEHFCAETPKRKSIKRKRAA